QGVLRRLAYGIADYVALTKPRISAMVLIVVAVSAFVAAGGQCTGWGLVHSLLGTLLVAASASALNQLFERRRDRMMERTANRPLPAGRLSMRQVTTFAIVTVAAGSLYLAWAVNLPAAAWALATWFIYVALYTPMKARTAQNTAVGAVSGALPVFIGWSTAGGSWNVLQQPTGLALFLLLFLWQFPHFMAIAWIYRQQYERAGLQMMTVVERTGRRAGWHAVVAAVLLLPVSWAPAMLLPWNESIVYLLVVTVLGAIQLRFATRFLLSRNDQTARALLRVTLLYLPLLLVALVIHTI
ncbi:MAG: heme o synthase, partial [Planctomycetes bacterium]|nr:heme o synthase [Planctomycetota bacterium]